MKGNEINVKESTDYNINQHVDGPGEFLQNKEMEDSKIFKTESIAVTSDLVENVRQ